MRLRIAQLVACFAWLLASGGHWDAIQAFAWGRMIVGYSRTMALDEAVTQTFDAANLCGVCEWVAENKTRDSATGADAPGDLVAKARPPLALPPTQVFFFAACAAREWPRDQAWRAEQWREAPPVEPPRAATVRFV
jgi:hypothetical protein